MWPAIRTCGTPLAYMNKVENASFLFQHPEINACFKNGNSVLTLSVRLAALCAIAYVCVMAHITAKRTTIVNEHISKWLLDGLIDWLIDK